MLPCQKVSLQKHIRLSLDLPQTSENRSAPIHRTLADFSGLESHDLSSFEYRRRNRRLPLLGRGRSFDANSPTCISTAGTPGNTPRRFGMKPEFLPATWAFTVTYRPRALPSIPYSW